MDATTHCQWPQLQQQPTHVRLRHVVDLLADIERRTLDADEREIVFAIWREANERVTLLELSTRDQSYFDAMGDG